MTNDAAPDLVSQGELVSNVRFGYWFNHLCERFYGRVDLMLNLLQLVGGSAAVVALAKDSPSITAASGILLVAASALALLVSPAVKAERHRRSKCEYLDLEAAAWTMSPQDLVIKLAAVRKDAPLGISSLAMPAVNATLRAIGRRDAVQPETILQRIAAAVGG